MCRSIDFQSIDAVCIHINMCVCVCVLNFIHTKHFCMDTKYNNQKYDIGYIDSFISLSLSLDTLVGTFLFLLMLLFSGFIIKLSTQTHTHREWEGERKKKKTSELKHLNIFVKDFIYDLYHHGMCFIVCLFVIFSLLLVMLLLLWWILHVYGQNIQVKNHTHTHTHSNTFILNWIRFFLVQFFFYIFDLFIVN